MDVDVAEINHRFDYHPPLTEERKAEHEHVRETMKAAAKDMAILLPEGREKPLVITALEEAMFWANAAVARQKEDTQDAG